MSVIKVKLSKIQFPDICPVCLEEAEDLVFVTVAERARDDFEARNWSAGRDRAQMILDAAQGATTFSVPTCMRHGSRSVRSFRSKMIAVIGFFIIFYPILYFLLSINLALTYSRNLTQPLTGFIATVLVLVAFLLYGFFPRGTARFRFIQLNYSLCYDDGQLLRDFNNLQYPLYFLASDLMETHFVYEFLSKPIQVNCSQVFEQSSSVAKIYAIFHSRIYTSINTG